MIKALGLIVIAGLLVGGFIVFRNISRRPTIEVAQPAELTETIPQNSRRVKQGPFTQIDAYHKGTGQATFYETDNGPRLVFENGFSVAAGPDLFVYLIKHPLPATLSPDLGELASLGRLKTTSGDQMYALPADYADYQSVAIWCRAFGVLFTAANLN